MFKNFYLIVITLFCLTTLQAISTFAQTKTTEQTKSSAQYLIEGTSITVKVVAVKDNAVAGSEFMKPAAGNKFVSVQIVMENIKGVDEWAVKPDKFKLKDAEGSVYDTENSLMGAVTQPTLKAGILDIGDLVKGWITFQVGDAVNIKTLKIRYEDAGFMSATAVKSGWINLSSVIK